MTMNISRFACGVGLSFLALFFGPRLALACDTCKIYVARQADGKVATGFSAGIAEQFSHFEGLRVNGNKIFDPADQYMDSSNTQFFLGYNFTDRVGVQINLPYIYREYLRPQGLTLQHGTVSGLGDLTLLFNVQPLRSMTPKTFFSFDLQGGVKFPTGNTDELKNELFGPGPACGTPAPNPNPVGFLAHHTGAVNRPQCPNAPINAISGYELTLGTGSYDGIFGAAAYFSFQRAYLSGNVQYILRTTADFGYEFEDEINWGIGPGFYLLLADEYSLSLMAQTNGYKDEEILIGPYLRATWKEWLSFGAGSEFLVHYDSPGLQITPEYRVFAALGFYLPLGV